LAPRGGFESDGGGLVFLWGLETSRSAVTTRISVMFCFLSHGGAVGKHGAAYAFYVLSQMLLVQSGGQMRMMRYPRIEQTHMLA
jgi:hypothetical protein